MPRSQRRPPGIQTPHRIGPPIAVLVMAGMGAYGFSTGLQNAMGDRPAPLMAKAEPDQARLAQGIAPVPTLLYAVRQATPPVPPKPRVARSQLVAPVIDPGRPAEVRLVREPAEVAGGPEPTPPILLPDASVEAMDASTKAATATTP